MKKNIILLCIVAMLSTLSVPAMAELEVEESGTINSSIIFGDSMSESDEEEKTDEEKTEEKEPASTTRPARGASLGAGVAVKNNTEEEEKEPEQEIAEETEEPEEIQIENPYSDVKENDWFFEDVMYAYQNNIMSGMGEGLFAPQSGVNRAMMITILYRSAGEPESGKAKFSDVAESAWYHNAVSWGAEQKIVSGTGENQFSPDAAITREQLAVILYNYRKITTEEDEKADISSYQDCKAVSAWAEDAVSWAVGNGIITGKGADVLAPTEGATRAEAAAIVRRFSKLLEEV